MRNPAVPLALLVPLMLVSAASRLSASGERAPPTRRRRTVVIASPEKPIVVDGDRVVVLDDDRPRSIADLPELPMRDDLPRVVRFHGHRGGGYLGVRSIEMTPELRQHFGAPKDAGVLVGTVEPESPAAKAGIQVGDILTAVDGEGVGSTRALSRSVRRPQGRRHRQGRPAAGSLEEDARRHDQGGRGPGRRAGDPHRRVRGRAARLRPGGLGARRRDWDRADFAPPPPAPPVPPAAPNGPALERPRGSDGQPRAAPQGHRGPAADTAASLSGAASRGIAAPPPRGPAKAGPDLESSSGWRCV